MKRIMALLEEIKKDVIEIKKTISEYPKRKLPFPAGFNPAGRRRHYSQALRGGLKDPEIRAAIIRLRGEGARLKDIATYIEEHWSDPAKHVPKSTIHRFLQSARNGRLREWGILPPVEL